MRKADNGIAAVTNVREPTSDKSVSFLLEGGLIDCSRPLCLSSWVWTSLPLTFQCVCHVCTADFDWLGKKKSLSTRRIGGRTPRILNLATRPSWFWRDHCTAYCEQNSAMSVRICSVLRRSVNIDQIRLMTQERQCRTNFCLYEAEHEAGGGQWSILTCPRFWEWRLVHHTTPRRNPNPLYGSGDCIRFCTFIKVNWVARSWCIELFCIRHVQFGNSVKCKVTSVQEMDLRGGGDILFPKGGWKRGLHRSHVVCLTLKTLLNIDFRCNLLNVKCYRNYAMWNCVWLSLNQIPACLG